MVIFVKKNNVREWHVWVGRRKKKERGERWERERERERETNEKCSWKVDVSLSGGRGRMGPTTWVFWRASEDPTVKEALTRSSSVWAPYLIFLCFLHVTLFPPCCVGPNPKHKRSYTAKTYYMGYSIITLQILKCHWIKFNSHDNIYL